MNSFLRDLLRAMKGRDGQGLDEFLKTLPEEQRLVFEKQLEDEFNTPPRIAVIGSTGVGKSSTINALFGAGLPVSHTEACTSDAVELTVDVFADSDARKLIVYDMPGLGEDIDADQQHIVTYRRVIAGCDVAVWIMAAPGVGRAMAYDQMMLRDVVASAGSDVIDRLVVGLNQVDAIQPGEWNTSANIPSREQKNSIERRIDDIVLKLRRVCPRLERDRIVPYSALRRYRLEDLFFQMLRAAPLHRQWVLKSRQNVADYRELVDPEILRRLAR